MKRIVVVAILAWLGSGLALATEPAASVAQGKALFNDRSLGAMIKSCNTCHPDGKGLEMAGEDEGLADTINACITHALQGQPLDPASVEMQSLILYIKSLAKE